MRTRKNRYREHLGQQHPTLERRRQHTGEPLGICLRAQLTPVTHHPQAPDEDS